MAMSMWRSAIPADSPYVVCCWQKWVADLKEHPSRNDTAYVFDPEFLCYSWQWVRNQGHKPSSGLVGMIFALKICKKVLFPDKLSQIVTRRLTQTKYRAQNSVCGEAFSSLPRFWRQVHAYGFQSKNYFSSTSRPHYYDWERPAKGREKVMNDVDVSNAAARFQTLTQHCNT